MTYHVTFVLLKPSHGSIHIPCVYLCLEAGTNRNINMIFKKKNFYRVQSKISEGSKKKTKLKLALMREVYNLFNFFVGDSLKIGEIIYKLKTPKNPELVPVKHSM